MDLAGRQRILLSSFTHPTAFLVNVTIPFLAVAAIATPAFAQGSNDCATPTPLSAAGTYTYDTSTATTSGFDGGGLCAAGASTINQDLFWVFTVPTAGDWTFDTNNTGFDTKLSVHSGVDCSASCIEYDDDDGAGNQSQVNVIGLSVGDTLLLQVGGFGSASGSGVLNLSMPPDCITLNPDPLEENDDCTAAFAVSDGLITSLNLADGDPDFYSTTVADGATLTVDFVFATAFADIDVYLWDPSVSCDSSVVGEGTVGGPLAIGFSNSDNEQLVYTNSTGASKDVIIEARTWSGTPGFCNVYDMEVTGSTGSGSIGSNYCMAATNSTGQIATMSASGSIVASNGDVTLMTSGLPANQFGIYVASMTQGFNMGTFGTSNGNICLGGVIGRFTLAHQIVSSGATGEFSLVVPTSNVPQGNGGVTIMPGDTWNFQAWHRDIVGLGSNFSDGLEITFI